MSPWSEIQQAAKEQRHELHLNGDVISDRLKSTDMKLPDELFALSALNYLEISYTTLATVPVQISKLSNLINLALHRNQIETVSDAINDLPKLKFLDLSFNRLTALPGTLQLEAVHTLNLSNNKLEDMADLSNAKALSIFHIEHNQLEKLPQGLETLTNLSEIYAASNLLNELPTEIKSFVSLKTLDVSDNKLKSVPGELVDCQKLKTLKLEGNPLSDNRLRKMTTQCNTKAILEYVAKQSGGGGGKKGGKKKKGGGAPAKESNEEEDAGGNVRSIHVIPNTDEEQRVIMDTSVKDVRPYICCTVIKNLDLRDEKVFKDFLSLQTKLHENECDMRTRATIATHTMSELKFPLKYIASVAQNTHILALGKQKKSSAASLIQNLKNERDVLKLKKKRQPKTGLYKFIDLVDGKEFIASVRNNDDVVISLPPITNGETSKITPTVSDVFIEITSPLSLPQCKHVMEELIKKMFQQNFSSKMSDDEGEQQQEGLVIQPIRVVDPNGDLKIIYPSKVDLDFNGIPVVRVTT